MDPRLNNLRLAYAELMGRVNTALRTQVGDRVRLNDVRTQVLSLAMAAEQQIDLFAPDEYQTLVQSLSAMAADLDAACDQSVDPPDAVPLPAAQPALTGRPGRPRIEIDRQFLEFALDVRGPTHIGDLLGCHPRTVRRRALELGLVSPGPPVFSTLQDPSGTSLNVHTTLTTPVSTLTDEMLDRTVADILTSFPNFGRRMIVGHLRSQGHHVPERRVAEAYVRVRGAPAIFGRRIIVRKKYQVAGPNSLVHHDGQHGLIRWKFVIHCFIDGHSRFVTGIRVHTNNRADTVLTLFREAIAQHGLPSRVRGDHGTENIRVAEFMEESRGLNRGSYIWGRSVHNTRIERLWYDVTQGFGSKWKTFLLELEHHHGLDADSAAHIWLLHHLFQHALNTDAHAWADAWNAHRLNITGERAASPRELFMFAAADDLGDGDPADYGIDWDAIDDTTLMAHHLAHNPSTTLQGSDSPFGPASGPEHLTEVSSQTQPGATRPTTQASEVISDADLSDSSLSTLGDGGDIPTITEAARAIELLAPAISDTVDLSHPTQNVPALLQEASLITQELAEFEEAFVDYSGQAGELLEVQNASDPCGGLVQADQVVLDVEVSAVSVPMQRTRALPAFRIPTRNLARLHRPHLHMPSTHCATTSGPESAIDSEANTRALSAVQDPVQPAAAAPSLPVRNKSSTEVQTAAGLVQSVTVTDIVQWARMGSLKNYRHARKRVANLYTLRHDLQRANSLAEAEMDMLAALSALCGSERLPTIQDLASLEPEAGIVEAVTARARTLEGQVIGPAVMSFNNTTTASSNLYYVPELADDRSNWITYKERIYMVLGACSLMRHLDAAAITESTTQEETATDSTGPPVYASLADEDYLAKVEAMGAKVNDYEQKEYTTHQQIYGTITDALLLKVKALLSAADIWAAELAAMGSPYPDNEFSAMLFQSLPVAYGTLLTTLSTTAHMTSHLPSPEYIS
ncbi:hypothetical protein ACG7TL_007940 [Trametes sanguinea]